MFDAVAALDPVAAAALGRLPGMAMLEKMAVGLFGQIGAQLEGMAARLRGKKAPEKALAKPRTTKAKSRRKVRGAGKSAE